MEEYIKNIGTLTRNNAFIFSMSHDLQEFIKNGNINSEQLIAILHDFEIKCIENEKKINLIFFGTEEYQR